MVVRAVPAVCINRVRGQERVGQEMVVGTGPAVCIKSILAYYTCMYTNEITTANHPLPSQANSIIVSTYSTHPPNSPRIALFFLLFFFFFFFYFSLFLSLSLSLPLSLSLSLSFRFSILEANCRRSTYRVFASPSSWPIPACVWHGSNFFPSMSCRDVTSLDLDLSGLKLKN